MRVKTLTRMALLTAIALAIFAVEAQIPVPIPVPGIKLGLANIVTVAALYWMGAGPALAILLVRVVLGCLATGQVAAIFYSLAGGLLSLAVMLPMRRVVGRKQIWVLSIVAAMTHNVGQILAAMVLTGTPQIVVYLPILLFSGIITGLFTGICAQLAIGRLQRFWE